MSCNHSLTLKNSINADTSETVVDHQRHARILEELPKRKLFIAPIWKVPDDVLVEILALALIGARWQIWRFSHVCRHWRQLCRSYARLWSHIEVDLTVDGPHADLISEWRERAWGTSQTIDLRLRLTQFEALKGILGGGLKYITHLRLAIPAVTILIAPMKFDLPPAFPCLQHLALRIDSYPFSFFDARVYITSLCHRFFTRRQTRCTGSLARFHLEFYNLAFKKLPRVMNCVHTVVLKKCTFTGSSMVLQFLEAAKFTIKYLEYSHCRISPSEPQTRTEPLTFPLLLTLKHYASDSDQFPILSILSCPALKTLTIGEGEAILCTVAQYPAIQELCLAKRYFRDASHADSPLLKDSKQLETFTISQLSSITVPDAWSLHHYKHVNLDTYTGSLRRFRFHFPHIRSSVEQFEYGLLELANDFARRGRDIEFELIQGGDWGINFW